MSDRIGVMSGGRLHQVGSPSEIYTRPATRFVLDFIGSVSYLPCRVVNHQSDSVSVAWGEEFEARSSFSVNRDTPRKGAARLAVRPEHVRLTPLAEALPAADAARGVVKLRAYLGDAWDYHVRVGDNVIRARTDSALCLEEGAEVSVRLRQAFVLSAGGVDPSAPVCSAASASQG